MSAVALTTTLASYWDELVAELPYGVLLYEGGVVIAANPSAAELLGVSAADLRTGVRPPNWEIRDDAGAPIPRIADLAAQRGRAGTTMTVPFVVTVEGTPLRRLWADLHPVYHRGRPLMLMVVRPVVVDPSRDRGLVDATTGLPLRALLFDRVEQSLVRARVHATRSTLVLADLCGLRAVNEEWGFAAGDQLLRLVADRLRTGLREDHTVARYSGGTFAIVSDHPRGTGEDLAARVRDIAGAELRVRAMTLRPRLRTGWVTSDGRHSVCRMVCAAEDVLRH
ncbi:MAG: GGDEF domain-containing protein [Actinomycetota bacterium]|nr:GGDEF domain-containing protein [Actinomycetota bacterium]